MFSFPNPVNEVAARIVAGAVLVASVATLTLSLALSPGWLWLTAPVAYGFLARVLTGPTLSPLATVATKLAPRLATARPVPGPPKRFAQGIGAAVTIAAVALLAAGIPGGTQILLALMIVAAGFESVAGYCIGCRLFALLMQAGVIPPETCAACADRTLRSAA
jgi:hypothetical protein